MADTGIFATTAEVQRKVGGFANATPNTEAYINDFMTQAESHINVRTRFNWSDAYSGLDVDVKGLLKEAASNLAAMYVIVYNMDGWTSQAKVETLLDVLLDRANAAMKILEGQKEKDFINGV